MKVDVKFTRTARKISKNTKVNEKKFKIAVATFHPKKMSYQIEREMNKIHSGNFKNSLKKKKKPDVEN